MARCERDEREDATLRALSTGNIWRGPPAGLGRVPKDPPDPLRLCFLAAIPEHPAITDLDPGYAEPPPPEGVHPPTENRSSPGTMARIGVVVPPVWIATRKSTSSTFLVQSAEISPAVACLTRAPPDSIDVTSTPVYSSPQAATNASPTRHISPTSISIVQIRDWAPSLTIALTMTGFLLSPGATGWTSPQSRHLPTGFRPRETTSWSVGTEQTGQ